MGRGGGVKTSLNPSACIDHDMSRILVTMALTSTTLMIMTIATTMMNSTTTTTQIYRGDVRHRQRHLPTTARAGFRAVGGWVEVESKFH